MLVGTWEPNLDTLVLMLITGLQQFIMVEILLVIMLIFGSILSIHRLGILGIDGMDNLFVLYVCSNLD